MQIGCDARLRCLTFVLPRARLDVSEGIARVVIDIAVDRHVDTDEGEFGCGTGTLREVQSVVEVPFIPIPPPPTSGILHRPVSIIDLVCDRLHRQDFYAKCRIHSRIVSQSNTDGCFTSGCAGSHDVILDLGHHR